MATAVHPIVDETMRELFGPDTQAGGQADESKANQVTAPNPPEDDFAEPLDRLRSLMAALYGSDFPLIRALDVLRDQDPSMTEMPSLDQMLEETEPDDWASWTRGRWGLHRAAVEMHLYLIARNRLFRAGQQWVSSKGREPWREPARPTESARVVHNLIAPALDQRIQIITDQRPSFEIEPLAESPDERRKAEGRQLALEFQYDQQGMEQRTKDAAYWAGTDGVAFWHTYWNRDKGPWDTRMGNVPNQRKPLGDVDTKVLRVEQVRVSANATASEPPYYAIIREVLSETEAAYLYGVAGVQDRATTGDLAGNGDNDSSGTGADGVMPSWVLTQTIVGEGNRLNNVKTVERFTMYVDKHPDVLPDGLQLVVVGNSVVWGPGELLFGTIPVVAVRDGSTDPSYFPRPIMEQWLAPQMRINAALSLWVNNARVNSGGRILARPDAISRETFVGSGLSLLEVEGAGPLGDTVQPMNGFSVGQDVKDLIAFDTKAFEDMSGYNDVSRGQISNETATAVASANEHIERVFAPAVEAVAVGCEQWAKVNLAAMAWGYDVPRDLGAIGTDRPDLARAVSAEDFDGPATVRVDKAKLLPMPRIYRLQILDDWYNRKLITPQQYMRNAQFASFKHLSSPDEDQEARAKRVADALRLGQQLPQAPDPQDPNAAQASAEPLAIRWQTNEAIEQDVLEREILLQDDLAPEIIQAADQRWRALAAQAQAKQGTPPPGSPDAIYQQFVQDTVQKVLAAASQYVAKEVTATEMLSGQQPPPGSPPTAATIPGQPGQPGSAGPPSPGGAPASPTPGGRPTSSPPPGGAGAPSPGGVFGQPQ